MLDYTPFKFEEARNSLEEIIRHSIGDKFKNDSLVVDVLGDYDIVFKQKMSVEKMSWEYYFKTIDQISLILKTAHEENDSEKKYSPDAVIGISNGGMIFADYLHRAKIYGPGDCQFHSLWANRDRAGKYFEYKSNELLLEGILKDTNKQPADVRILLVDDNVGSGDTSKLAMEFIKRHFAAIHVRFLPLFFNREDILPRIYKHLIWSHRVFLWEHPEIENLHFVNYRYFPYPKSISG